MRAYSLVLLALAALPAQCQQFGPAENLAPYIPSPQAIVERMLEVGKVKPGETVYDLGAGDGRVIITAAQMFGAKAVGIEIQPDLCYKTEQKIKALGLADRVRMVHGSALRTDLRDADVVTMYFTTLSNEKLKPELEKMRPGSRVVSNQFPIKGWKPAEAVIIKTGNVERTIYLYQIGKTK
jgi:ubiquinone/menaquinone biosynthesis C-methylase UbiE